jgi:hypothetical protein
VLLTRDEDRKSVDNFDEIPDAAALGSSLGASYLNVKAMQNADHSVYHYTSEQRGRIATAMSRARSLETETFRLIASANLGAALDGNFAQPKDYSRCLSVALRTLVTPEGMYPCAYHRGNPALKFPADPTVDQFNDMWMTAAQTTVDPRTDCQFHCARHEANLELERGMSNAHLSTSSDAADSEIQDWDLFI